MKYLVQIPVEVSGTLSQEQNIQLINIIETLISKDVTLIGSIKIDPIKNE
jgi:hypothetical protein